MIINIKVKPSSGQRKIENFGEHRYLVYLKSPPENNQANAELINLLSKFFGMPVGRIKIKRGMTSNEKMIELN